jgi:hypothetical protein
MSLFRKKIHEKFSFTELPLEIEPIANKFGVFANNEICLSDIKVYGFDYDYTLASYKDDLHHVLYDLGKEALIEKYKVTISTIENKYSKKFQFFWVVFLANLSLFPILFILKKFSVFQTILQVKKISQHDVECVILLTFITIYLNITFTKPFKEIILFVNMIALLCWVY